MTFTKYAYLGAALAVAVNASPAPQQADFPAITAAPSVANGPLNNGDGDQTASLVTTFIPPSASAAPAAPTDGSVDKRWMKFSNQQWQQQQQGCVCPWYDVMCLWSKPICPTTKSSSAPATTYTSTQAASASLPSCPASSYTPYYAALTTGYTTNPAATKTGTAAGSCPTQVEDGTYCGFINPEDPCAPQPDGYGPVPKPDTPDAFLKDPELHALAQTAPQIVPSTGNTQYTQVFKDLNGATSAQSYLGLRTLKSYDVKTCAAFCDCTELCTAFNIYAERDPSLNPSTNQSTAPTVWGRDCPNPPSQTDFKCTLWGSNIDASTATNMGETREEFEVVITASDGYDKTNVATPPQYVPHAQKGPKDCGGKAIDAPKYWLGKQFFPGPYNPEACYDYAVAQNAANSKAGVKQSCKFFNAYYLFKNNKPHGTYCNLYNSEIDVKYATYGGGKSGSDQYDCKQSWGYTL